MKGLAVSILLWAGCTLALGLIARVMWSIFIIGWGLL
jgi:hypothetical protein